MIELAAKTWINGILHNYAWTQALPYAEDVLILAGYKRRSTQVLYTAPEYRR